MNFMPLLMRKYLQGHHNLLKYTQTLFLMDDAYGERLIRRLRSGRCRYKKERGRLRSGYDCMAHGKARIRARIEYQKERAYAPWVTDVRNACFF